MVNFKGAHFEKAIPLMCVRWYAAYPLSYRHPGGMMQEPCASVDHSTIHWWVLNYAPPLEVSELLTSVLTEVHRHRSVPKILS
jgi:putative transposase